MKNKKFLRGIAIILTIILVLLELYVYIKMKSTWLDIGSNYHPYENASLIMIGSIRFGALIWGILLIPIVWIEYFFTKLFIKIYSTLVGFKKIFLCLITSLIILMLLVFFIRMILLIVMLVR